ncbi:hypothetical protein BJ912DRAFT_853425 [Pholiota molesta]|nr:hypothetical protein BJ912DRAFT_853425 [Pholiota molesta]
MADYVPDLANTTAHKLATAKQKKDTGDQAFKLGNVKDALKSYHEALMYLLGLDKNALQSLGVGSKSPSTDATEGAKEKTEVRRRHSGKIYANMSACHLKNRTGKEQQRRQTRRALAKNENNYKALFRKGKALGEQGFFDKAVKVLEDLKTKNPQISVFSDVALVDQEIARLRAIDDERKEHIKEDER